jgi:methylglutaconyl-CoA hydratase
MAAMSSTILLNTDSRGVATLTLNRPEKHNALDAELVAALHAAFVRLRSDADVRVVVLTGAGKTFCSGADLEHMQRMVEAGEEENSRDALNLAACLRALSTLDKPVVARVQGNAFGGGIGLVCCADIAVAASHARFCLSEVRLGLAPAVIAPFVVASIGLRQMRRLMLTADTIEAPQALEIGLIHRHALELDLAIEQEVDLLLKGGPVAQGTAKSLLRDLVDADAGLHDDHSGRHAAVLAQLRAGDEGREGLRAFMEKRKPDWAS